ATTKVKRVNDQEQIQALVDKKKVIIMEDNIRSDLHFDDAEGTVCLLNEAIFEGLALIGVKTTAWNEFSSIVASAIICLADNHKLNYSKLGARFSRAITPLFDTMMVQAAADIEVSHDESEDEDHVPIPSSDPLPSEAKDAQGKEIAALKKKVSKIIQWRKLRSRGLRRLKKISSCRRVKSLLENDSLGAQEDASKQGRMIVEIDQDDKVALDDDAQGRTNDDEMFRVDDLAGEEVV
nr:hypothetical protein [Tanacetum cinerariifolium]